MVEITEAWVDSKNHKLYTRTWEPIDNVIATVIFVHGLGEHCSRYDEMFTIFAQNGIKVKSFDQRGFGNTVRLNGIHGVGDRIQTTFSDIALLSKQTQIPAVPHFIMGHSMGGGVALLFAHKYPQGFAGVIASAPLIKPAPATQPSYVERMVLGHVLANIIPTFVIPNKVDSKHISRDPKVIEDYLNDPLNHGWASIGLCNLY
jgi:acylglycerol lipase